MTTESSRKRKGKVRWSKLYSYACFRPCDAGSAEDLLGQPGFSRVVFCNKPQLHKTKPYKYPDNYVSTTKYNVITFLPKALFEQFRRVANLYFLLAAILSCFPKVSPFKKESMITPLVFVVGVSMFKEALEDWHRFLQDRNVNSRTVKVHVGDGVFVHKAWRALLVGDVVKVHKNEYFPSDLLLLSSSYEDGVCYVETMNLDGETNLKFKRCLESTLDLDDEVEFRKFESTIRCEDPNPNLYTFVGNLEFQNQSHPLCPSQLLLRDSKLRNTDYIYGVVIFSGRDTKAVRNSTKSPSKRSRIERKMDRVIYLLFAFLVLISLTTSFGSAIVIKSQMPNWWYLMLQNVDPLLKPFKADDFFNPSKPGASAILQFIRALILYGYLIPISLYVSIEVVKVLQAVLINKDIEMYDEVTCKSVEARTSNLNEELGQVEMIFSDKTGTLTCNQMEFRKCSIAGVSYGGNTNVVQLAASKRVNADFESYQEPDSISQSYEMYGFSVDDVSIQKGSFGHQEEEMNPNTGKYVEQESLNLIKGFNFMDDRLMNKNWISRPNLFDVTMFFRVMALCHTGIPVEDDQTDKLKYEAESPEEVAFLVASQEFGFQFCKRTQSVMVVKELDPFSGNELDREYKLLNLLEFSSSRKRMSVIVSNEEGKIFLLCKGADSIIFDRLADTGRSYQQATTVHLSCYAEDGFRTLAFAYRTVEVAEYKRWNSIFTTAKTTVGPEREAMLNRASEMIEKDLTLLGVVAVEDKLQKGVPECIDKLSQAGLKIWLLTGDKKETAINIGFSCSLLRQDMKQFHLSLSQEAEAKNKTKAVKKDILNQIETCYQVMTEEGSRNAPFALVVDGKALEVALHIDLKDQFLKLAVNCASVICCRVSPKQKALITRLVKAYTGKTTLAIGDGANDVGMIQEADIGVGISGMEGMQAVMASDFSLPQFRFLERLLIVHGHWCYKRISKMVLYFVYKNIAIGLTLFFYEVSTSFSGEVLYDDWYMVLFNVILTSLPVLSLGVLEQDVSSDVCLQFPALYQQGPRNVHFSWSRIIGWILNGIATSVIIFYINLYALSLRAFRKDGNTADITHLGTVAYTCVIWTVNCQIALIINHFTWIQHLFIWGSIFSWYVFLFFYAALPPAYSPRGFHIFLEAIGPAPIYWMITLLVVVVALLPYFMHLVIKRMFYPMDDHLLQEMKKSNTHVIENRMWLREQHNSKRMTHVGFSARVDAKVDFMKDQISEKRSSIHPRAAP